MKKVKIGVLGAHRGQTMIDIIKAHPDAELVAVCDKNKQALEKIGSGITLYESLEDFFSHDMDAVVLANYANEHADIAIRFLESGRHVMSEVLPTQTIAQAVRLIEAVESSKKVYAYAENYCYMTIPFEMRNRYEKGEIGEIQYAEGEYIHDCSSIWSEFTNNNDKTHWRNTMYPTYYCTHSLGPILTITGLRPVQVIGFETNMNPASNPAISFNGGSGGIEMVTLENGAIVKSIHGGLKREPGSINYQIYGTKGMMESNRFDGSNMSCYIEGENLCHGELNTYNPEPFITTDLSKSIKGHGGSDFYTTHFFIEKILDRPLGHKYAIDVYTAVDMGICGILAYRSIINGNIPIKVPNLRNLDERNMYRYDG